MTLPTLDQIACRLGTDKSTLTSLPDGPDGFSSRARVGHAYTVFYEEYFHQRRADPVSMLEIGVLDGRSLAMWAEYFAAGRIYGLDIDPACSRFDGPRTKVFIGSQDDPTVLAAAKASVPGGFDIVIDDGSHYVKHMIASFHGLFDHVKPGGYYVIEDVSVATDARWGQVPFNRGMALRAESGGNSIADMTRFLHEIEARDDVADLGIHLHAIAFVRKRAPGDPASPPYRRGERIDRLFTVRPPLWRRMARRLLGS